MLKTVDGGRSWRELLLVRDTQATEFGIGFISADRGWVGTAAGGFETSDGDRTWRRASLAPFANKIRTSTAGGETKVYAIGTEVQSIP